MGPEVHATFDVVPQKSSVKPEDGGLHRQEDLHQENPAALEKQKALHQEDVAGLEEGSVTL